jgi:hypothetical protein
MPLLYAFLFQLFQRIHFARRSDLKNNNAVNFKVFTYLTRTNFSESTFAQNSVQAERVLVHRPFFQPFPLQVSVEVDAFQKFFERRFGKKVSSLSKIRDKKVRNSQILTGKLRKKCHLKALCRVSRRWPILYSR